MMERAIDSATSLCVKYAICRWLFRAATAACVTMIVVNFS
jgi:hypothetical protein